MASSSGMSTSGASPVPRPQPPSLRFLDAEMDLALPPSLFSATMPEIISTTATHVPMHQVCGPLTTKLPGSMPGSGNPLVVSAVAAEQPPIPPLYGQSSPSSSSWSYTARTRALTNCRAASCDASNRQPTTAAAAFAAYA